jgi:hypothetical protein
LIHRLDQAVFAGGDLRAAERGHKITSDNLNEVASAELSAMVAGELAV